MPTYVAFLRAINLGPRNKYPMAELRAALATAGFADVATYIQTGNVRLTTPMRSVARLTERLEQVVTADRGFPLSVAVLTRAELRDAAAEGERRLAAALADAGEERVHGQYVSFLRDAPEPAAVARLEALVDPDRARLVVRDRVVHLTLFEGYQQTSLDGARMDKTLGVRSTSRNLTVVRRVSADWT
ncbi:MAG TPA: DUF1697 domain-containing protein [Nocardioides sp.]